ncbi:hypothetical protein [Streptomyces sp. MZ04]|uniref:hypothetical protein n=1 Tax=Streptomyces sp. MZ04 TaxID=2559236 RepID=UPI00107E9D76|nr:hypothetical protein [Streptomyces sp. MZ04]TGB01803.1 hypothetical protein E2651_27265 [Streptomyces sp. MZ04]
MNAVTVRRPLDLDTLVRFGRGRPAGAAVPPSARLAVPEGMSQPLGCDAVAVPAGVGPRLMARLPRVGCVYEDDDGARWWWIVPADSDVALEWPFPAYYAAGAVVPGARRSPSLIHCPTVAGGVPYTPPIPLYLALCRVTGTTPGWARAVRA